MTQCTAVHYTSPDERTAPGYLRLEIEPEDAEVFIDDEYRGAIRGWRDGVVAVRPGLRRIEIRADGYMTQRFDIEIASHEEVTLELSMEAEFESFEETGRRETD